MTLGEQVGSLRRTLHRALSRRVALHSRRPIPQLLALRVVSRHEVTTQAELAERLLIDAPAASRLVVQLEEAGLLRRRAGADRRTVRLEVTRAARAEIAAMDDGYRWLEREVGRRLSPKERTTTLRLLRKLEIGIRASSKVRRP